MTYFSRKRLATTSGMGDSPESHRLTVRSSRHATSREPEPNPEKIESIVPRVVAQITRRKSGVVANQVLVVELPAGDSE